LGPGEILEWYNVDWEELALCLGPAIADANEPTADVSLLRSWTAKAPTTSDPALRALLCVAPGDDVRDDAAFPAGRGPPGAARTGA